MKYENLAFWLTMACLIMISFSGCAKAKTGTISFKASDGVRITADLYIPNPESSPFILLCHRAEWSRGEYLKTALWLNEAGFNCMAIDQRSGFKVNKIENLTFLDALKRRKGTGYADALADIISALEYVRKTYKPETVLLFGSSYSSALAFPAAAERADLIDGIVSFSPGEYFSDQGKSASWIKTSASQVTVPVFIASSRLEYSQALSIFEEVKVGNKVLFAPEAGGVHGSEALWETSARSSEYRAALLDFLGQFLR